MTRAQKAERLLHQRLANIDHLRDVALENGNDRLLDRADELEKLALRQYDRRIAKIGTTDPEEAVSESSEETNRGRKAPGRFRVRQAAAEESEFGQTTAAEARKLRREFGKQTSERVSNIPPTENETEPAPTE